MIRISKNQKMHRAIPAVNWLVVMLLSACGSSPSATPQTAPSATFEKPALSATAAAPASITPTIKPSLAATVTASATSTEVPVLSLKVMTFNVLAGAGVDRRYDDDITPERRYNRLSDLEALIRQADPDILGIQEAVSWGDGDPPAAAQVGADLGMDYFLAESDVSGLSVAVFSKYKIVEREVLTPKIGPHGFLRARIITPDGEPLNVFVVHYLPFVEASFRLCETEGLLSIMERYVNERTIILGDFNAPIDANEIKPFLDSGWELAEYAAIDHIRVSPGVRWTASSYVKLSPEQIIQISDHPPVTAKIDFFPSQGEPTLTPWPTPTAFPSDPVLSAYLENPQLIQVAPYDLQKNCYKHLWYTSGRNIEIIQGQLIIFGEPDWSGGLRMVQKFTENRGVLLRMKYSEDWEAGIFFGHGEWQAPDYRRFSLSFNPDGLQIDKVLGATWLESQQLRMDFTPQPETWYNLLLAVTPEGQFLALMWDPADLGKVVKYREDMGEGWSGLSWSYKIEANQGYVSIKEVQILAFTSLR